MAKTIKFNLICDGKPVRTLEDLRNNFSIEDMVEYYNNQLLHRWLNVRGFSKELEKVEKLQGQDTLPLVKELIAIFEVETDSVSIEENTYIMQYKQEAEVMLEEYKELNFKTSSIIDDYHVGYRQLVDTIIENNKDIAKIKAAIREIIKSYSGLYELDYRNLFYTLLDEAPLAVFVMLMNDNMRKKYLPTVTTNGEGKEMNDTDENSETYDSDKEHMYECICNLLDDNKLYEVVGENLKICSEETDGYWKDVEPKGKKYMILSMKYGNYVRSAGILGGDLSSYHTDENFIILDGIDYKSNNAEHKLFYMEV